MMKLLITLMIVGAIVARLLFVDPDISADQALIGCRALQIMRGEQPVMNYVGGNVGCFSAYLSAIFFHLTGPSGKNLRLVTLFLSILFVISTFILARDICGRSIGLLSMFFVSLPPIFLTFWSIAPEGGFLETLLFGNLILILTNRIIYGSARGQDLSAGHPGGLLSAGKSRSGLFFLLGLVSGLGYWTYGLVIYYLATAALFLFLADKRILFRRDFIILLLGFFLGSAPFWHFNLTHSFLTFRYKHHELSQFAQIPGTIRTYLVETIPRILGYRLSLSFSYRSLLTPIYLAALGYVIVNRRKKILSLAKFRLQGTSGLEMLLVLGLVISALYCFTKYGTFSISGANKVLPIFSIVPIFLSFFLFRVKRFSKPLFILLVLFIIGSNLAAHVDAYRGSNSPEARKEAERRSGLGSLASFLECKGITHAYADRDTSWRLTFNTREKIILSMPWMGIWPEYTQMVDAAPHSVYIIRKQTNTLRNSFCLLGAAYEEERVRDRFTVFYGFEAPHFGWEEIEPAMWQASSNYNELEVGKAFDRVAETRWTTGKPQGPGAYYELDLGRVEEVNRITLFCLGEKDYPRQFTLLVSVDGKEWEEILSMLGCYHPGLHWSGCHVYWERGRGDIDIYFSPRKARHIKMVLKASQDIYFWSINDMFVYRPLVKPVSGRDDMDVVLNYLKEKEVKQIYGEEWLMAKVAAASRGRIKSLWRYDRLNFYNKVPRVVNLDDKTVFIVSQDKGSRLARELKRFGWEAEKEIVGGYLVFNSFHSPQPQELFWTGEHLLRKKIDLSLIGLR